MKNSWQLVAVIVIALVALYVDLNIAHPQWMKSLLFWRPEETREIALQLGLDLQGGIQVLLAPDVPEGQSVEIEKMRTVRRIIENRVNALGLTEPIVQMQGEGRIIVELPGITDPEQAVETIKGTALLEFFDSGYTFLPPGTLVTTTLGGPRISTPPVETTTPFTPLIPLAPTVSATPTAVPIATAAPGTTSITSTEMLTATSPATSTTPSEHPGGTVYTTILTGNDLENAEIAISERNEYSVRFAFKPEAAQTLAEFTAAHAPPTGQRGTYHLCIALDKVVISCPVINSVIPDGEGVIEGNFTYEEVSRLVLQLQSGALPVPLRVESLNRIGATLGQESVQRSIRAGLIGLVTVLLFMVVYYRLPGSLAAAALVIYVLINFALYKTLPITLTLPGIAGFLLSAGMAVDANILIFERMKEELRRGRGLASATEIGFSRAWTSIRDSQLSTLIICGILLLFGTQFGASMVKGVAITLAIGTVINIFTAVFATRIFLRQIAASAGEWLSERKWLLGV